jgi:hypothetical protein|eukprot:1953286-Prymnesium_polylepis.1
MAPKKKRPPPTAALAAVKRKREAEAIAREAAAAAEDSHSEAAADEEPALEQQPPPPMTADEIATALDAEGLMLLPSRREGAKTGYKGVYPTGDMQWPYVAQLRRDGRNIVLGKFTTTAEAALTYARAIGPAEVKAAAALLARPLSAREVKAAVKAEGLRLQRSKNASGYKGVSIGSGERKRPYNVDVRGNFLGCFESAEEAALVYARATRPVRLTSMAGSSMALAGLTGAARALEGVAD